MSRLFRRRESAVRVIASSDLHTLLFHIVSKLLDPNIEKLSPKNLLPHQGRSSEIGVKSITSAFEPSVNAPASSTTSDFPQVSVRESIPAARNGSKSPPP